MSEHRRFDDLRARLSSVVAIPVTPFDERGEIDQPGYTKVLRRMVEGGIDVFTANGTTGEFFALTAAERICSSQVRPPGRDVIMPHRVTEALHGWGLL